MIISCQVEPCVGAVLLTEVGQHTRHGRILGLSLEEFDGAMRQFGQQSVERCHRGRPEDVVAYIDQESVGPRRDIIEPQDPRQSARKVRVAIRDAVGLDLVFDTEGRMDVLARQFVDRRPRRWRLVALAPAAARGLASSARLRWLRLAHPRIPAGAARPPRRRLFPQHLLVLLDELPPTVIRQIIGIVLIEGSGHLLHAIIVLDNKHPRPKAILALRTRAPEGLVEAVERAVITLIAALFGDDRAQRALATDHSDHLTPSRIVPLETILGVAFTRQ